MILPGILIVILTVFVFYCMINMIKRGHDLHAMAFLTLLVYTIFGQVAYAYFPELCMVLGSYFGPDLFYKYWAFMFISFIISYVIYLKTNPQNEQKPVYKVKETGNKLGERVFFFITIVLFLSLSIFFVRNRDMFGWGGGAPMGSASFALTFRIFTMCTFFLYVYFRNSTNKKFIRRLVFILFIICLIFFLNVTIAAGTRSDILYFFIAIAFFELSPIVGAFKYHKKKIIVFTISSVVLVNFLMMLLSLRASGDATNFSSFVDSSKKDNDTEKAISEKILFQDYFPPSQTLFVSLEYEYIDPIETFLSNVANSLILIKYPYLTHTITAKVGFAYDRSEGAEGWANHFFCEGYNAMGFLGVLYNGIFWNIGMMFWCMFVRSNNKNHNRAMLAILCFFIVNTMRSQTCAFIQYSWMIIIPAMILLLLSTNSKITFIKRRKIETQQL